jgi:hypothetical protein
VCNAVYAHLKQQLLAALVMADGKDRAEAVDAWERDLYAPLGGWQQADQNLFRAIVTAPD